MRAWLARALSEKGEPSSNRLISVVGLLVLAPVMLARVCPTEQFAGAFEVWCAMVAGVYGVGKVATAFGKRPAAPVSPPSETTP
jgi:tetrahydromethanopterin S-methyltransferase subunit C